MGAVLAAQPCDPARPNGYTEVVLRRGSKSRAEHMPMAASWQGFSMEQARQFADAGQQAAMSKTPQEVFAELQRGNMRFWTGAAARPEASAFERRALIAKQFPSVAILGCSDSRVPVEIVFDVGLGDIFVVRVAGNCLDTASMASLQYAVHHLKVKVLMVLGHEGCGAVKAAGLPAAQIKEQPEALGGLLNNLKAGLDHDRLGSIQDSRAYDREAVVTNVLKQIETLSADDGIMQKVKDSELMCVGGFYDISSGIVDYFSEVTVTDGGARSGAMEKARLSTASSVDKKALQQSPTLLTSSPVGASKK
eukprot:TRINITY_DN4954_c0_g2_i1.p1 TRINITY_DN4954_c0_g2~~TRINITY_DN4954_c0_g2_i1.p1  ORF type:complete len:307 (+),score=84.38 TRINITY_DN4954_c0_g2_i1:102-1022(+)